MDLNDHIQDYVQKLRGNWKKFESFGWHDQPEDADNWCLVYTHNRDSGLVEQSNAIQIEAALAPFLDIHKEENDNDVVREDHSHWAVGWVKGYAIRVFKEEDSGEVTEAFRKWVELSVSLADYPLLNESHYSQLEYEAALEAIRQVGDRLVRLFGGKWAPKNWESRVFSWLWEHNQEALENRDDQGAYPSEDAVREALKALKLLRKGS